MNFRDSLRVSRPLKNGRRDFQLFTKETGRVVNRFSADLIPRGRNAAIIEVSQAAMNLLGRLTTEVLARQSRNQSRNKNFHHEGREEHEG